MTQKQYVAKPHKVKAEQFTTGMTPLAVGVCTAANPQGICAAGQPMFSDWRPHVHTMTGDFELQNGDWITHSVAFPGHGPDRLTDAEFTELYGSQGPPLSEGR